MRPAVEPLVIGVGQGEFVCDATATEVALVSETFHRWPSLPASQVKLPGKLEVCEMKIGKVVGRVGGMAKPPASKGTKILIVQPLDAQGKPVGCAYPAMDMAGAGEDDTV